MRHRIAALVASGLLAVGAPALAQTTETTVAETTGTSVAEAPAAGGYEPAVVAEPAAPSEAEQPWTVRFLIPTLLALATIVLFATAVRYFTNVVRARYRVVE